MKTIPLYGVKARGRVALVDDADYELVMQYRWNVYERQVPRKRLCGPYAKSGHYVDGHKVTLFMHKLITGYERTDHKNHDGLDNRRANLRDATRSQNGMNVRPLDSTCTSRFKGVTWHKQCGKWQASIMLNQRSIYLGLFQDETDAAVAYDIAAVKYFGEFAYLNFREEP